MHHYTIYSGGPRSVAAVCVACGDSVPKEALAAESSLSLYSRREEGPNSPLSCCRAAVIRPLLQLVGIPYSSSDATANLGHFGLPSRNVRTSEIEAEVLRTDSCSRVLCFARRSRAREVNRGLPSATIRGAYDGGSWQERDIVVALHVATSPKIHV